MSKSLNIYLVLSSLHVTDKKTDSRRNWVTSVCIENLTGLCKISPKIQSREIQEVGSNRLELDMAFPHPWKTVLWQSFMKREKSDSSIKRELYIKQPIRDLNFLSVATSLIEAVVSEFLEYGLPNFMVHMNQSRCLLKKNLSLSFYIRNYYSVIFALGQELIYEFSQVITGIVYPILIYIVNILHH